MRALRGTRSVSGVAVSLILLHTLAACGGGETVATAGPTATVTVTATVVAEPAESPPQQPDTPQGEGAFTPDVSPSIPTVAQPGAITLGTFFNPGEEWQENLYNVADKPGVRGVKSSIGEACSSRDGGQELELRLGAARKSVKFSVGQSADSESSQRTMTVRVFADNEPVEVKKVKFGQIQPFALDVAGVNALRVRFILDGDPNECSSATPISPVLFDGTVE